MSAAGEQWGGVTQNSILPAVNVTTLPNRALHPNGVPAVASNL